MVSKLPTFFASIGDLVSGHPVCFTNGALVVLSALGEEFFRSVAFDCPNDPKLASQYSLLFVLAPMGVLFICGMTLNTHLWRVFHGCCKRHKNAELGWCQMLKPFSYVFFQSLLVPSVWLFVALLQGSFYVCYEAEGRKVQTEMALLKAESQKYAWIWLLVMVCGGALVTCCLRCCDRKTFLEFYYSEVYKRVEDAELEEKMNERAKALSGVYFKDLFSSSLPTKETWDSAALPDSKSQYFSSLQKWYAEGRGQKSQTVNQTVVEMTSVNTEDNRGATSQPVAAGGDLFGAQAFDPFLPKTEN